MTKKICIICLICTAILFFIGMFMMQKTSVLYNITNQSTLRNISSASSGIAQGIIQKIIPVSTVITSQRDLLNEDLENFMSYSEKVQARIFNRTSYIKKELNGWSEFVSTITNAVGLDQSSEPKSTRRILNSTVLLLSANMAYADITCNFLCRLAKISKTFKYVVVAQDTSFYNFLQSHGIPSISGNLIHPISTENAENFRSSGFNAISIAKIIAARVILELGYNVFFSDVDIGWTKNPVPFLPTDVDLVIQVNTGTNIFPLSGEPNTGFYFLRSNDRSMALLEDTITRGRKDPSMDDQTHFANALRDWRVSKKAIFVMEGMTAPWIYHGNRPFTFRILNPYRFLTGQVAMEIDAHRVEPPYGGQEQDIILVHANFLVGHSSKVRFLKSHKFWDLNDQKFQTDLARWKSQKESNNEQKKRDQQVSYQSALDRLAQVCDNLIT